MKAGELDWVANIVARSDLRAGAFIVTLFGDVVEPRGGRLATRSIIEACRRVGLNASQVRTALSRLVAAGRLEGTREGRRSHYRLTPLARAEFLSAARAIFAPQRPSGWAIVWAPPGAEVERLEARAGRIGPDFFLAPGDVAAPGCLVFSAGDPATPPLLQRLARKLWPLQACEASYAEFEAMFAPLETAMARGEDVAGETALTLRLLLTHRFRAAALQDPGLPASALGAGWRGDTARGVFSALYLALSPAAEAAIPSLFSNGARPLSADAPTARERAAELRRWLEPSAARLAEPQA